jgi:hypothetical protein
MDINTQLLINHSDHFVASRRQTAMTYHYGNGSRAASMIAALAAGVRRLASAIEGWARGGEMEVIEHRLPRPNSAR